MERKRTGGLNVMSAALCAALLVAAAAIAAFGVFSFFTHPGGPEWQQEALSGLSGMRIALNMALVWAMISAFAVLLITHITRNDLAIFRNLCLSALFATAVYALSLVALYGGLEFEPAAARGEILFPLIAVFTCGSVIFDLRFAASIGSESPKVSPVKAVSVALVVLCALFIAFSGGGTPAAAIVAAVSGGVLFSAFQVITIFRAIKQGQKFALFAAISSLFLTAGLVFNSLYISGILSDRFWLVFPSCLVACVVTLAVVLGRVDRDNIRSMRESDQALKEMADKEIAMLTGQIQPHFVYNTLSSIRTLIKISPDKAYDMVYDFSKYLRTVMDAMGETRLIGFEQELENIRVYLNVEMVRFSQRLRIEWDIEATGFVLPPLSIQPLVENAVKHGVCKRAEGGTVKISSFEDEAHYVVEVKDDGVGFNPEAVMSASQASGSIGLKNVRLRLARTLMATLWIESEEGKGTSAVVRFPKDTQKSVEG